MQDIQRYELVWDWWRHERCIVLYTKHFASSGRLLHCIAGERLAAVLPLAMSKCRRGWNQIHSERVFVYPKKKKKRGENVFDRKVHLTCPTSWASESATCCCAFQTFVFAWRKLLLDAAKHPSQGPCISTSTAKKTEAGSAGSHCTSRARDRPCLSASGSSIPSTTNAKVGPRIEDCCDLDRALVLHLKNSLICFSPRPSSASNIKFWSTYFCRRLSLWPAVKLVL